MQGDKIRAETYEQEESKMRTSGPRRRRLELK
jgi:hypothetical protein